ncbi:MAG: tyrosine--tRNA ligase [Clostridia bacterium]|nr:tyrosine--tRNA ligase [Clostridia bacterium]
MNVFDVLKARGFIKQTVYEEDMYRMLDSEKVPFYVGFDPTADSLHIGHYIPVMAMAHMQKFGHKPIVLVGGGTAMVGDPSGRTDMRSMMTTETIENNCKAFYKQLGRFLDFEGENKAIMVNNAEWLRPLNYIDFIREIGVYFSVNKMLTAECYRSRMEKGLSFLEFNYMLMQGYDFLELFRRYGCKLQLGGNDQWNNMLAGADLIRRKERQDAFAMTFTLLETSDGKKMGKTAKGALWLDENKTTPYEFFQYFRNVEDVKVEECLKLLTFVELEEIEELCKYKDERINEAKIRLAYEVTKLVHGEAAAEKAKAEAAANFSGNTGNMSVVEVSADDPLVVDLMVLAGVCTSKSEARRLIEGGGVKINDSKVEGVGVKVSDLTSDSEFILHKGKKVHLKVCLK